MWLYENFSSNCLQYLKEQGTAKPIVVEMAFYFVLGILCTAGFLLATIFTFKHVSDRKLAIIPIALVSALVPSSRPVLWQQGLPAWQW